MPCFDDVLSAWCAPQSLEGSLASLSLQLPPAATPAEIDLIVNDGAPSDDNDDHLSSLASGDEEEVRVHAVVTSPASKWCAGFAGGLNDTCCGLLAGGYTRVCAQVRRAGNWDGSTEPPESIAPSSPSPRRA